MEWRKPLPGRCSALLQIGHHAAAGEHDLLKAQHVRSVLGSITTGSDDVAVPERTLVPTTHADKHDRTPGFAAPFFDLAFVVFYVQENLHMRIDKLEVRDGSFDRHDLFRVVVHFSVMCEERRRKKETGENQGQAEHQIFHFLILLKIPDQVETGPVTSPASPPSYRRFGSSPHPHRTVPPESNSALTGNPGELSRALCTPSGPRSRDRPPNDRGPAAVCARQDVERRCEDDPCGRATS